MRVAFLVLLGLVVVAALLVGLDVVDLGTKSATRGEVDGADAPDLRAAAGAEAEASRLVGRPGAGADRASEAGETGVREEEEATPSRVAGGTPGGARLTGRVVEGGGGAPVPGAIVRLGMGNVLYAYLRAEVHGRFDELVARTDADGRFAFRDVTPARDYVVRVTAEGRPAASVRELDLRGRPDKDLGDVVLGTPATLTGRVVDGRGVGIADARIAVTWMVLNPMGIVLADPDTLPEIEAETRTDEQGAFVVEGLEAGEKSIVVDAGSRGQDAVHGFAVAAGEATVLHDVVLDGEAVLAGRVQADDGQAMEGARVFAGLDGSAAVRTTETAVDGTWRLESLPAGRFTVGVLVPGMPLQLVQGVEAGREDLLVTFASAGEVRGRVTARASGDAVPVFRVRLESTEPPEADFVSRYLQRLIDEVIGPLPVRNADGRFAIAPVPPGRYRVRVEAEGFPATGSEEIVVASRKVAAVEVALPQGHGLLGVVTGDEGAPVTGVRVYVAPAAVAERARARINPAVLEQWAEEEHIAAVSDGEGTFALPPQTPGVYYLLLLHEDYQPTLVENVDLQREATAPVPMRLESSGGLAGTLLGADGQGVAGEPVALVFPGGAVYVLETDAEGRFERKALPPGEALASWFAFDLEARVQAMQAATDAEARATAFAALREGGAQGVVVVPGQSTSVTLRTGPRTRVEGTLRVDGGPPGGGYIVWIVREGSGHGRQADVEASGRFEALLPPGGYQFWAQSSAGEWSATRVRVEDATGQRVELAR